MLSPEVPTFNSPDRERQSRPHHPVGAAVRISGGYFQLQVGSHFVTAPHLRHSCVRHPCSTVQWVGAFQPTRTRPGPNWRRPRQWEALWSRTGPAPARPNRARRVHGGRYVRPGPAVIPNPHPTAMPLEDPRHLRGHAADPAARDRPPHPGPVQRRTEVAGHSPNIGIERPRRLSSAGAFLVVTDRLRDRPSRAGPAPSPRPAPEGR